MSAIRTIQLKKLLPLRMFVFFLILLPSNLVHGTDKPRKCILVFGSHADDVEQIAGGTFAKYIAEGYQGIYVCVMNNLSGNRIEKFPGNWDFETDRLTSAITVSPEMYQVDALETMQIRKEEAIRPGGNT
jgi:LmbE family N-acetylglucosaminyl deacetylase